MLRYFLPLFLACILFSCDDKQSKEPEIEDIAPIKQAIIESNNSFSLDIFKQIVRNEEPEKNVFISPLSMYYALSMAGTGAANKTKDEFIELLGWENKTDEEILKSMNELYLNLKPQNIGVTLEIANSLWSRKGAPIKDIYKNQTQDYFDAEVRELDFTSPEAVDIINSWIEVKTNNKIQDMLDVISPDAIMYLINAVYFKANWKYEFKEEDTFEGQFYKTNGTSDKVDYMQQKTNLNYFSNDLFTSVKLPYADSNFYMEILVPNNSFNTDDILNQMSIENLKNWNLQYAMHEVLVTLPKFKFDFGTRNIVPELQSLRLNEAFSPNADFSPITDIQIYISRVLHKAFIEVNEKGSEAAAATIIEFEYTSIGNESFSLMANKPFIFSICHEPTQSIMFLGRVENIE